MKIYISEKYLDLELLSKSEAIVVGSDFDILSPMGTDGGEYVLAEIQEDTEVQTIEQHDRKLLQEFYDYIDKNAYYAHGMIDFREHLLENFIKERS